MFRDSLILVLNSVVIADYLFDINWKCSTGRLLLFQGYKLAVIVSVMFSLATIVLVLWDSDGQLASYLMIIDCCLMVVC